MIHGHTKIELYDARKRIRKVTESDNTFQSGILASFMRSLGEADCNPFRNDTFRTAKPWTNLVGGLFLFKNGEDDGNKYMTAGNQMIGCGSYGIVNSDVPNTLGSYNVNESSASASAITQVYDFSTSQANGTIGCVCLTSQTGGYIGYGNNGNEVAATKYDIIRNQTSLVIDQTNSHNNAYRPVTLKNTRYEFTNNGDGTITVKKTRVGVTIGSIFQGYSTSINFDLSDAGNHLDITTQIMLVIGVDGDYIYLHPNKDQVVPASGTGYLYKYDISNDTLTEISFTNSSNIQISVMRATVSNGCIFAKNQNSHVSVFDLATSVLIADLTEIQQNWDVSWVATTCKLSDGLTLVLDRVGNGRVWIFDHSTHTVRLVNAVIGNDYNYFRDDASDILNFIPYGSYGAINEYLYKNPLYLATINNIQPVTKTAAQTMKVTYTLTEV